MKRLWQILNMPLVVAFLSIVAVFGLLYLNLFRIFSIFDQDHKRRNEIEALGRLQIVSFAEVESPTNAPQKYVGRLRNNSSFIVDEVEAAICAYDTDGKLKDVLSRKLTGIGKVAPDQERDFFVDRTYEWDGRAGEYFRVQAAKTTVSIVAANVTEAMK
jgi:hypothetical protein